MTIIYLLLIALVVGLIISFISFLLEHIFVLIVVVVLLGGLIVGILCIKEKFDDKKAAKERSKRVNAVREKVEKYNSSENKEELPEDADVLNALAIQFKNKGDAAGQFAVAQKLYEKFDNGAMLVKCYCEGIGTEKDVPKGRNLQKEIMHKRMTMQNGKYALSTWRTWWKADGFFVDLQEMLQIAREFCNNKNPLGVGFMEDVQLALVGDIAEETLANGTWRNRLGYEPYSLYHTNGKMIKENELAEEKYRNVGYDLSSYFIRNKCVFGLYGGVNEKLIPLYREFKEEVERRLQDPEKIEKEARARAEKIWEKVYRFEAAKEAVRIGDKSVDISAFKELCAGEDGYALVWFLRNQAQKGEPSAYFKLAECHKNGAYLFSADRSENNQKYIAEDLEKKGAEKYKTRAINGNADAQYHHGLHLEQALYGVTSTPDISKAMDFYRRAARQKHPRANGELLNMVDFGVTFEEADSYAKWIQESCASCDTFEKRSAMRSLWAYQIRGKLSDQWTILRKTKDEAPADNAAECFELAKKYVESEVVDIRLGNISAKTGINQNELFCQNAVRMHGDDWKAIFELVYEYNWRIYYVIYKNYNVFEWDQNVHKEGYVKNALKKHRNPIYEYDLICGALTQYCAALRWQAAQAGDLDAIEDLCRLYNGRNQDRLRSGINVFFSALNYWCEAALNTKTGRGYYIAGYYWDKKVYLQKALDMGYAAAQKAIDDIEHLEQLRAESERIFNEPYSSHGTSGAVRSEAGAGSAKEASPMDEFNANRSFQNMPSLIYDAANNVWKKVHAYDTTAVYRNDELGEETITSCDISSKYASGYSRTFHWW